MATPSFIVLVRIPDRLVFVTKGVQQEMCAQDSAILADAAGFSSRLTSDTASKRELKMA